ncbi:MAG: lamin tail domain-containing protein [Acidobacteriia bacterium]|nr:lamin tail domain-containing protein [Terriglobia bacterium]
MGRDRRPTFSPMKLVLGARIRVKEVRNEGRSESVVIANEGHMDQPLTGWMLASLKGTQVFRFDDGLVLHPGASVIVTSGQGVAHKPPTTLAWTDETVWNNRGDVALLFDYEGSEVARFAYPASRAEQVERLPKQLLVREDSGAFRIESSRREPSRNRQKVPRSVKSKA